MKPFQTPFVMALSSLVVCVIVDVLVIAADPGVMQSPLRLSILALVTVGVPAGNFMLAARRRTAAGHG